MRISAFLSESPMFAVYRAARSFDALASTAFAADDLNFLEGLTLATLFFESPRPIQPSQLALTFGTTRGNISHCISSLEAKGLLSRRIDPEDARAYLLQLKPAGKRAALRVIRTFDRLQHSFEKEAGKIPLREAIATLHTLENIRSTE